MLDEHLGHVTYRMRGIPDEGTKSAMRPFLAKGATVKAILNGTEMTIPVFSQHGLDRIRAALVGTPMQEEPHSIAALQGNGAPPAPPAPPAEA